MPSWLLLVCRPAGKTALRHEHRSAQSLLVAAFYAFTPLTEDTRTELLAVLPLIR